MAKSKYHSKKINRYGVTWDSAKELRRYEELLLMEKAGAIQNLQRQVKYLLIPAQYEEKWYPRLNAYGRGKCLERAVYYIADFTYTQDGRLVVEDVKGYKQGTAYAVFVLKRKLMLKEHGIRVREV